MPQDKLSSIEYPEASYAETSLQTIKSFVDIFGSLVPVPIIAPTIAKCIEYSLSSMQEKRVRELVDAIKQHILDMPEEIYKSEEFAEALKKCISRYVNEGSKEKRQLLVNMNKSLMELFPTDKEKVFNLYLIFDELFMQLSLPSLQALMHFEEHLKVKAAKGHIIEYLLATQAIHARRCFSELVSQGLLEEDGEYRLPTFNLQPQKVVDDLDRVYRISPLAGVFLAWLRHELDRHKDDN